MSLLCYIVDDHEHSISLITKYINRLSQTELAGSDTDARTALRKIESGEIKADVTFTDIMMPKINGLELLSLIKDLTEVVLISADDSNAIKAYDLGVIDYLLKPFTFERFKECISKVEAKIAQGKRIIIDHFYVITDKSVKTRIKFADIIYIESFKNYQYFHLLNEPKKLSTYLTLVEIEEELPSSIFLRVNKSFIVNMDQIISVDRDFIHMSNGALVSIGSTYAKDVDFRINKVLIKSKRRR